MNTSIQEPDEKIFITRAFEVVIRVGTVGLLLVWCFQIAKPFLTTIVWGIIIAVAARSNHKRLETALGGRGRTAAILVTLVFLVILIVPTILLSSTMIDSAQTLSAKLQDGSLQVPPPSKNIATWPLVGDSLYASWQLASTNLEATLAKIAPTLKTIGSWLLSNIAGAGAWVLQFILSIIIAGVFLANVSGARRVAQAVAERLAGEKGPELLDIAGATVQSVTRGILGVAMIQAVLAGIGMFVVGVPGAGLWSLLVLLFAVIQLPALLVLGPVILYVFSTSSTVAAVIFTIWTILVGASDTFLKPVLLGRGAPVPMLVIFIGAIGGFITSGIIGLFVGAVVFSLGYQLFMAWLKMEEGASVAAEKS